MDARTLRAIITANLLILPNLAATYSTPNFVVKAANSEIARTCALTAERQRRELAIEWLGSAMPNWSKPCEVTVTTGPNMGAGGATSFLFDGGEVFGWVMSVQGSYERVLDSVLPHEITHTIFASHFRRPLPRWADEGGATSVEHSSERLKHRQWLYEFIRDGRAITLERLFSLTEYPQDVMPLYAQGYSVANYLIQTRDRRTYVKFLESAIRTRSWALALREHYGIDSVQRLQVVWNDWTKRGCPRLEQVSPMDPDRAIASNRSAGNVRPVAAVEPVGRTHWQAASNDLILHVGKDEQLPIAKATSSDGWTRSQPATPSADTTRQVAGIQVIPKDPPKDIPSQRMIASTSSTESSNGWQQMGAITPLVRTRPRDITPKADSPTQPQRTSTSTQVALPQGLRGPGQVLFEWSKQDGSSAMR